MKKYVVTGFDEHYWNTWGMSWLASLQNIAKYEDDIIVVGFNLSQITKNKLFDANVNLISSTAKTDFRENVLLEIAKFASEDEVFAYWDADVYFQESIDSIFDLAKDNFVASVNSNLGFLAGPSSCWKSLLRINSLMNFTDDKRDLFKCVLNFFDKMFLRVNNTWNFTNVTNLKDVDGKLLFKREIQKVIHLSGVIKTLLEKKNILFSERHPELNSLFKKKTLKLIPALHHTINQQPEEVRIEPRP